MARFEDAIQWVMGGGRARRQRWARMPEYTRATPPLFYERIWRIWQTEGGQIFQGWGGQIGLELDPLDPIRDGTYYHASDDDRTAVDWELIQPSVNSSSTR